MKKIFLFSLISTIVVISSLSYVNYILLNDSTIDLINTKKEAIDLDVSDAKKVRYIQSNPSTFKTNSNFDMLLYISNDILYSLDLSSDSSEIINTDSFVSDFSFFEDSSILYASKKENEVEIYTLDLTTNESNCLGSLSYKNFTGLKNVYAKDDLIYFDIEYFNNGEVHTRSYIYKDSNIQRSNKNSSVASILLDDNYIYETLDTTVYINDLTFSYNDNQKYSLLGANQKNNTVYLLDSNTKESILSLNIQDTIDILEDINISNIKYNKILISESLYLLGDNFIIDLNDSIKVNLNENVNIVHVSKESIYFVYNNYLMKINY